MLIFSSCLSFATPAQTVGIQLLLPLSLLIVALYAVCVAWRWHRLKQKRVQQDDFNAAEARTDVDNAANRQGCSFALWHIVPPCCCRRLLLEHMAVKILVATSVASLFLALLLIPLGVLTVSEGKNQYVPFVRPLAAGGVIMLLLGVVFGVVSLLVRYYTAGYRAQQKAALNARIEQQVPVGNLDSSEPVLRPTSNGPLTEEHTWSRSV